MKIAFLGLGIMGSRMAANLAAAGHAMTVWNRTASTAERFAREHDAAMADTPAGAAAAAELVFTMVVDGAQVGEILFGPHGAAGVDGSRLFIDCSTTGAPEAARIASGLGERGHRFLDAPVTGSSPRAQDGTLTFMVGGADGDFNAAKPAFEAMGSLIVHAGPTGQGQVVKVINNALAAVNTTALGQALILARAAGADLDALIKVVGSGSGGSTMLDLKAGPMRDHDYTTLFKLDHMLKDVRLCLDQAGVSGVTFALAGEAETVLSDASDKGFGDADFAALLESLEASAGTRV